MSKDGKPKKWMFTVTIREGIDEFWETKPIKSQVREEVFAALVNNGFFDCKVK